MPKLSICYIVRNEIECLPASVLKMRKLADEIVIVDTGSHDGTDAWAQVVADTYGSIGWNDDFSEARNYAIELATGDWILMIDADEWIDERYFPEIYKLIYNEGGIDGYMLQVYNFLQDPFWIKKPYIFYGKALRLFKKKENVFYDGIIHERLMNVENVEEVGVPVYHFQFHEAKKINKKFKKYVSMMERKIKAEGRTFINLVHLSDAYRRKYIWTQDEKALKKMLAILDEALKINNDPTILQVYNEYKKRMEVSHAGQS